MYHEVYTPERTHSGISLFGLFLQVYTHKDLGGITQSVPTNQNSVNLQLCHLFGGAAVGKRRPTLQMRNGARSVD